MLEKVEKIIWIWLLEPAKPVRVYSQGAYGYEEVAISWHLTMPPPLTIFATKAKRLRLESGTQVLLRMFPPGAK